MNISAKYEQYRTLLGVFLSLMILGSCAENSSISVSSEILGGVAGASLSVGTRSRIAGNVIDRE